MRNAMSLSDRAAVETVIEPPKGWQMVDFKELLAYRDLLIFLVKRDITVLYAQTVLGFVWAVVNPLIQIVVFSIIFGRIAKLDSEGMPYFLFSAVAIIPWTYMSDTMSAASQSLVGGQSMLGKVYFPRIIFPLTPIFAKLMDFGISLLLLVSVMIYYRVVPTWNLVLLPLFMLMMMSIPAGVGFWLASLAIRFRDVKFAMPFVVRMLIYSAPILYSAAKIPADYRFWYSMNPVVGVVEGFRACLLGTAIPWEFIVPGMLTTVLLVATGAMYFRRMERIVVDVI
jgi:lipopolysaccharide transport system permease protein